MSEYVVDKLMNECEWTARDFFLLNGKKKGGRGGKGFIRGYGGRMKRKRKKKKKKKWKKKRKKKKKKKKKKKNWRCDLFRFWFPCFLMTSRSWIQNGREGRALFGRTIGLCTGLKDRTMPCDCGIRRKRRMDAVKFFFLDHGVEAGGEPCFLPQPPLILRLVFSFRRHTMGSDGIDPRSRRRSPWLRSIMFERKQGHRNGIGKQGCTCWVNDTCGYDGSGFRCSVYNIDHGI